ncbi:MAG TPA: Hpt domain-containing protein [Phycisphaerales bacterium]|nr:Hpt domain-containing protein [Phycisphaerales bacterium]
MPHPAENSHSGPAAPLHSRFAQDPQMKELVAFFLDDLQPRTKNLQDALHASDLAQLWHLAHQLKCAASGYGYPEITECAAVVEQESLNAQPDLFNLTIKVQDLLSLCNRAVASR